MAEDWQKQKTDKRGSKTLSGKVISVKMKDTAVVSVERFVKHPKYGKYRRITKRYKAHDAGNSKKLGDWVTIVACRPISKNKHFRITESAKSKM
ncbi:MAG: 30S ribosomal protein S17 [Candidatus Taylorbacteria bacterium]|nr:30S ribosomal protein S17 [Candidatus Taylorbacteria bacterium]